MFNKLRIIALVLAVALVFSGCSLLSVNQDRVDKQVVATVNGVAIDRETVIAEAQASYEYLYLMYYKGWTEDDLSTNSEAKQWYEELLSSTLDQLVLNEVLKQKAPDLGIALTDDELAQQRTDADKKFTDLKDEAQTDVETENSGNGVTMTDEELAAAVEQRYQEYVQQTGFTPDTYYDYLIENALVGKVMQYINDQAVVTDEEALKWYNDKLTEQQADMTADPSVFTSDINDGQICTYVPEDTVAVKQVLLTFKDADITAVAQQMYNDGDKEGAMKLLQPEIDALMPLATDIEQQLKNGANIEDLITQYGEDPGMTTGAGATYGYLVGPSTMVYIPEFSEAALTLKNVGDVSAPTATYLGLHILQAIKEYKQGVVPFEDIKDQIKQAMLADKQSQKYDELSQQWKDEAKITYDRNRLTNFS